MAYALVFTPEANSQLLRLYKYVADRASPTDAERFVSSLVTACEKTCNFPHRGSPRNDIRPGMHLSHYKKRTVIVYHVDDIEAIVSIIGIYHGGQNIVITPSTD